MWATPLAPSRFAPEGFSLRRSDSLSAPVFCAGPPGSLVDRLRLGLMARRCSAPGTAHGCWRGDLAVVVPGSQPNFPVVLATSKIEGRSGAGQESAEPITCDAEGALDARSGGRRLACEEGGAETFVGGLSPRPPGFDPSGGRGSAHT
ncbi:hypothetical protein GCM10023317_33130 [Actinopolymorpha pittospori]